MLTFIECTDFYKTGHPAQMEPGTTRIYENWTARGPRNAAWSHVVFFYLQAFLKYDLTDLANRTFFSRSKSDVLYDYQKMMDNCIYPGIDIRHIGALHDLQYIPLEFCALPEGTQVPYRVPMFTVENTHDDFAWVSGYIETFMSSRLWLPMTSATTAFRYRKLLDLYAKATGGSPEFVEWQGHDFSFRGMAAPEAAAASAAGHLLSFSGTDTIPGIKILKDCYDGQGLIGGSVPATEHMVMCLGGQENELETYRRLLKTYPSGVLSIVSDTWNLWNVVGNLLPQLREEILSRDGKLVIRPDSGDPVKIICGDPNAREGSPEHRGLVSLLWDLFGGTVNEMGFLCLNPHIGAIYGDSITEERAESICKRLTARGFASTNVVFGIGSYTYQYVTRDTHGNALKATWARVNGRERFLFKDPITDNGLKRSARGRLAVIANEYGHLQQIDGLSLEEQQLQKGNLLSPVWRDSRFLLRNSLEGIKSRLHSGRGV